MSLIINAIANLIKIDKNLIISQYRTMKNEFLELT